MKIEINEGNRMMDKICLRITDEEPIPEGYMPLITFFINEEMKLMSRYEKGIPNEIIISAIKQWLEHEESHLNKDRG